MFFFNCFADFTTRKNFIKFSKKTVEHWCLFRNKWYQMVIIHTVRSFSYTTKNSVDTNLNTDAFLYSLKNQKTKGFLIFSGGIERNWWHDMRKRN